MKCYVTEVFPPHPPIHLLWSNSYCLSCAFSHHSQIYLSIDVFAVKFTWQWNRTCISFEGFLFACFFHLYYLEMYKIVRTCRFRWKIFQFKWEIVVSGTFPFCNRTSFWLPWNHAGVYHGQQSANMKPAKAATQLVVAKTLHWAFLETVQTRCYKLYKMITTPWVSSMSQCGLAVCW